MDKQLFVEVIVDNKCRETDRVYSYSVSQDLIEKINIGCRVLVPFGISNKKTEAYVVGLLDDVSFNKSRLKQVIKLIDQEPVMSTQLVELAKWMKNKYICYYIEAIQTVVPAPVRIKSSYEIELREDINIGEALKGSSSDKLIEIVEYLENNNNKASLSELKTHFSDIKLDYYIKKLIDMNLITKKQSIKNKVGIKVHKLLHINNDTDINIPSNAPKQRELIDIVKANPGISMEEVRERCGSCVAAVKTLLGKGILFIEEKENYRYTFSSEYQDKRHKLTDIQQAALMQILDQFAQNRNVLLHGVTGSGKTEVYLEIIEQNLMSGKDAIVLVPEISLTPQMIERFKGRFGDNVAVLHSNLSEGEKYDEWRKIRSGMVKVAVGARSAVFAPFSNLGIIIIDEEHESTYKSEIKPKYLTREVAEKRCELEGARLILGSATPSIETYFQAQTGRLGLVKMLNRVNNKPMPEVEVVDMREELKNGNKTIFSEKMTEEILNTIRNDNQLILFLNRRGHSTFVTCRQCGLVMKCPRCSISLTYHMNEDKLNCHYCGFEAANPKVCPKCRSSSIRYFGVGTQKLEKEFRSKFSINNVLRMDADTTSRKQSHEKILSSFRKKESKVLIGTQMISKGLDFPDVTMVGVITADTSLNLPDFRAAERTFQMIAQVAGRSGRGDKKGTVIVQTYSPEHYSIMYAQNHDYEGFYDQEIRLRQELEYPPFSHVASIIISGLNESKVIKAANDIGGFIKIELESAEIIEMLGPVSAPLSKIKNRHRWQILLKAKKQDVLKGILLKLVNDTTLDLNDININMDLNPYSML